MQVRWNVSYGESGGCRLQQGGLAFTFLGSFGKHEFYDSDRCFFLTPLHTHRKLPLQWPEDQPLGPPVERQHPGCRNSILEAG